MSPFGPLIPPQPRVYFRSEPLNDALPTAHYPLPTFLRPLFSYSYELFFVPKEVKSFAIKQIRTLAQNTGGARVPLAWPAHESQGTSHKSRPFSSLQPLSRLFALFSAPVPFVFSSLQPLFPKGRGLASADPLGGHPGVGRTSALSAPARRRRACPSEGGLGVIIPRLFVFRLSFRFVLRRGKMEPLNLGTKP